jgi:hypothetical protein
MRERETREREGDKERERGSEGEIDVYEKAGELEV